MPFPAARLALPHVGGSRDQGPGAAARPNPQIRGVLRRRESAQRRIRAHVLRRIQCRDLPRLPPKTAAAPFDSKAHDHRARQRALPPRSTTGCVPAQVSACALIAVPAVLQPAAGLDRAGLEARAPLGDTQPLLRHSRRAAPGRERLLRCLAPTQSGTQTTMLHYLGRCV